MEGCTTLLRLAKALRKSAAGERTAGEDDMSCDMEVGEVKVGFAAEEEEVGFTSVCRGDSGAAGEGFSTMEVSFSSASGVPAALRSHHMRTLEPTEVSFCGSAAVLTPADG